nr:retrovirus-related Pol polyprotein from transposon TNT 1-94 [Tanacetum cinerariifolium]
MFGFGEHAVHCKKLSEFKYRHDMVKDVLFDISRRAGISVKKEAPVNFLTDPSDERYTLRSADVLVGLEGNIAYAMVSREKEEKANSTIFLCLPDEVLYEVGDEETTKGVWKKLETIYMTKSLTNKLLLKQHLFSLRMKEGSSLKEHLDALNTILMDLKNVEVKIKDEDAALVLLVSLPHSFESFVSLFVVGKDTITLEDVRSSLHSRELRQQASKSGYESQSMGLSTTGREWGRYRFEKGKDNGGASLSSQGPNPRDICNYCKETGHWKIDCPKPKEKALVAATAKDDSCYSGSECDLL